MSNLKGKQSLLPPKCPFPSITPSYTEYNPIGSKQIPITREGLFRQHQRTSSESFIEEQPSWLDDLLNEPDTPVKRGAHRRSSSDSFAYMDANSMYSSVDKLGQVGNHSSETKMIGKSQMSASLNNYQNNMGANVGSFSGGREHAKPVEKQEHEESSRETNGGSERKEGSNSSQPQSEADTKRVKQQFAQRSRVRKLQYIAELERNVQALQAEGMEISGELEFADQQNLILNMENQTLKQRLESLAQEHRIKKLQHEMLQREITRLRLLHQQHNQQQSAQSAHTHRRSNSRDLESQFNNLSLKQKESNLHA